MLIDLLQYNIHPTGIVHVGAHWAQEHETYLKMGCKKITYIEPSTYAFRVLSLKFEHNNDVTLINAAAGSKIGKVKLNIERNNQGQSNSILEMGTHLKQHPGISFTESEEVPMITLDMLDNKGYDMLVMDCQGYEGEIIKGASNFLKGMKWVYSEVNRAEVYKGCTMVDDFDKLLPEFIRIVTAPWIGGWSDALYIRK